MDCTPATLVRQAVCYTGLPRDRMQALLVYLLCQWANSTPSPPVAGDYLTDDQGVYITDDQGNRIIVKV